LTDRLGLGGGQCLLSRLGAIAGQNADKTGNRHACGNDRLTHVGAQNTVQHHQAAELVLRKTVRGAITDNISAFAAQASGLPRGQDAEIKKPAHRENGRAQGENMVNYKYSC
jgi:hypothetical protein